jgi:hypothetical protein
MTATLFSHLSRWWNKPRPSAQPDRTVSLGLETLERRALPSASPLANLQPPLNDTYLATVYQGELKRDIDAGGLVYWRDQLAQGSSRTQVTQGILSSNEYFSDDIASDYNTLLGRSPDPVGGQFFLQALQHGATPQEVEASIMGSEEFFARIGGDPVSFLNAVYGRVLNRAVDGQGFAYFGPLTGSAAGRDQVVEQIETSPEAAQLAVTTIYQDTVGRTPDAAGLAYWAGQLERGGSQTTVLAGVLGSGEFLGRLQSDVASLNTSDPNVAASQFISAAGLFQSQPRVVPAAVLPAPSQPCDNGPADQTPVDTGNNCDNGSNTGVIAALGGDSTGSDTSTDTPVCGTPSDDTSGDSTDDTSSCASSIPDYSGDSGDSCDTGSFVDGCDAGTDF